MSQHKEGNFSAPKQGFPEKITHFIEYKVRQLAAALKDISSILQCWQRSAFFSSVVWDVFCQTPGTADVSNGLSLYQRRRSTTFGIAAAAAVAVAGSSWQGFYWRRCKSHLHCRLLLTRLQHLDIRKKYWVTKTSVQKQSLEFQGHRRLSSFVLAFCSLSACLC